MNSSSVQRKAVPMLQFLLGDWLGIPELLERERFVEHSWATVNDVLAATSDIAAEFFEPAARISDVEEPRHAGDSALLPSATHNAWRAFRDFGFLSSCHDAEIGGLQLPRTVDLATRVLINAAGANLVPALLTQHNASLLLRFGTKAQQGAFAHPQLAGECTGTMCLSEPHAGSSLADITTKAVPDGDDFACDPLGPRFRLFGNKMWISAGEHDLTPNIVHLVLAKVPRPDGSVDPSTRGISLFVVPKILPSAGNSGTTRNDVMLVGLNHKLGSRGIPNAALAFGGGSYTPGGAPGAVGYLVGDEGDGLKQMFHMMNAARIEVGLIAASVGFAGYAASLEYARMRTQGRLPGQKSPGAPVTIAQHADVKRMLLAQKAYCEGAVALGLFAARLLDDVETGSAEQALRAGMLLEILTPVVKSWPSEWCLESNSLAIQVLGGSGYTRDFPVEMYWRDQRLNMIHEGTNGIQGIDLLGRKTQDKGGTLLRLLGEEIASTVRQARAASFIDEAAALDDAWESVNRATEDAWASNERSSALANSTPYLQGFGHVVIAWILLDVAIVAEQSSHAESPGKIAAMRYFYSYELGKVSAFLGPVIRQEMLCRDLPVDAL